MGHLPCSQHLPNSVPTTPTRTLRFSQHVNFLPSPEKQGERRGQMAMTDSETLPESLYWAQSPSPFAYCASSTTKARTVKLQTKKPHRGMMCSRRGRARTNTMASHLRSQAPSKERKQHFFSTPNRSWSPHHIFPWLDPRGDTVSAVYLFPSMSQF